MAIVVDNVEAFKEDADTGKIIFTGSGFGAVEGLLVLMTRSKGGGPVAITSWSDTQIVATDTPGQTYRGYLINPDGSGLTLLAESGIFPTWSPDGAQIIYGPGRRGEGVLRVINSDGSGEAVLAQGAFYAVWSPDGSRIAAIFNEPDRSTSIAVMNADGSGRKEIAH